MSLPLPFALAVAFLYLGLLAAPAQTQPLDVLQFGSQFYSVIENEDAVALVVRRTGRMTDYATVHLRFELGSASTNDFESSVYAVDFEPGQSNATVRIQILNDALFESTEFFDVILTDPDPFCCQLGSLTGTRVFIQDNDLGVEFSPGYYSVGENEGQLQVHVSRFGDMTNAAGSVALQIEGGTATPNVDFVLTTNRVWFSPGQTNATISILVINDAVQDGSKNFRLWFEPDPDPLCCPLGTFRSAWIEIFDNDRGVEFSSWSFYVAEENPQPVIQLHRMGDLVAEECFFTIGFSNGTAISDIDYSLAETIFLFEAGQSNLTLPLFILNDALREDIESFSLYLDDLSNCPKGYQPSATIHIADNDPGVFFSASSYIAKENEQETTIHFTRLGDATNAFTVDLLLGGSAVAGADFIRPTNRLHFADGQTNLSLVLSLLDDPFVEGEEYVYLSLTNATDNVPLGLASTCIVALQDNEYPSATPAFWFLSNQLFAAENQTNVFITVVRGGNSSSTLSVDFVTAGDAAAGLDFTLLSGTLVFQPLETVKNIALQLIRDCRVETNETVEIILTNPSPAAVVGDPARTAVLIIDNDAPGSLDALDPAFGWLSFPNTNDFPTTAIALQPDGKILIGRNGVMARLNNDGSQDPSFAHGATICGFFGGRGGIFTTLCRVNTILLKPSGDILAGGQGSAIRLNPAGILDSNFVVTAVSYGFHGAILPGHINQLLRQADGKIILFGTFDTINGEGEWCGWSWCDVSPSRLNADSSIDRTFVRDPQLAQATRGALLPDGKILAAAWSSLHRLHPDGSRDDAFPLVSTDGQIHAIAVRPDQRVLIGGQFSRVTNDYRRALARLNGNGSLDTNFNPAIVLADAGEIMAVQTLTLSEDASIFLAGSFADGSTRVLKLDSDGRLTPQFNSGLRFNSQGFSATINAIIEEPNGALLVAGDFDNVNGIPRPGIVRLKGARSHIQLSPPQLRPDGSLRIVTGSHVGSSYILQRSSDLTAWTDISTNVATDCTLELQDPNPASTRFYRVVELNR